MPSVRNTDFAGQENGNILSKDSTMPQVLAPLRLSLSGTEDDKDGSVSNSIKRLDLGFTGTRQGMKGEQPHKVAAVLKLIARLYPEHELWVHHGDCTGSDEELHNMAKELGYKIHVHPPTNNKLRAYCRGDVTEYPKSYKIRNADIVRSSILLIATPHRSEDADRYSGTWATVRIAQRRRVPYVIFRQDGKREGGNKWKKVLDPKI